MGIARGQKHSGAGSPACRGRLGRARAASLRAGFTLVEMIVVVGVVIVLAGISMPVFVSFLRSTRHDLTILKMNRIAEASLLMFQDTRALPRQKTTAGVCGLLDLAPPAPPAVNPCSTLAGWNGPYIASGVAGKSEQSSKAPWLVDGYGKDFRYFEGHVGVMEANAHLFSNGENQVLEASVLVPASGPAIMNWKGDDLYKRIDAQHLNRDTRTQETVLELWEIRNAIEKYNRDRAADNPSLPKLEAPWVWRTDYWTDTIDQSPGGKPSMLRRLEDNGYLPRRILAGSYKLAVPFDKYVYDAFDRIYYTNPQITGWAFLEQSAQFSSGSITNYASAEVKSTALYYPNWNETK